ncbi:efflux transporter periplasmic adaptor subunit [Photobacterium sanctipauli]|uniref:Efflux transporter periplasmic adaptor subunit n=2 Tax=Photobacterium sanctipauli TaxID=1342794 RepID=A0A2T3NXS4_9GAMM|nr:efflux RND transporter periplasmic adaptor subunit [Photobacterium sanctipauli]PSW21056.1 efflux transporter periplasmic adaptor subunit [Photobacterium sanctipauli]
MTKNSASKTFITTLLCLAPVLATANETEASAIPVTVEPVATKSITQHIEEVGKITAHDSANLTFSAGAKIKAIHFNDGEAVEAGTVIAELDSTKAKADYDKAQSSLKLAETNLARTLNLLAKQPDALSPQDVDGIREEVNLAKADFRQKEATLKDYTIVAPFDGRLTTFSYSVGSHIDASTPLVSLFKLDPVKVTYSISQEDLGKAHKGQAASVTVSAYPNQEFTGQVNYIAPAVDDSSGRVEVNANINNPNLTLAPGMFADVRHKLEVAKQQLVVPQTAIVAHNDTRYIWVIKDNKPTRKTVTLGANTNDGYVAVNSGLNKGELVVTAGQHKLNENVTVKVMDQPLKETEEDS